MRILVKKIENLIARLGQCIPELNTAPLYANPPAEIEQLTVMNWLYQHLSEQQLMVYEKLTEYYGHLPELTPLANLSLPVDPADFIFTQIEGIDWSTAKVDPYELPYVTPWLEHINFYLKPHNLRLVDLLPFENAFIFCIQDDEALLQQLEDSLAALDIGISINTRPSMDQQQVADNIAAIISGN